ncbi:MAG: peptidoglycan editing factor PgeF [Campylobacterota bacterium]|nr:peptidoglycan editing factor PgeF [Campylobacterota bacterium]
MVLFTDIDDENIAYHVTNDINQVNNAREKLSKKHNYDNKKLHYMEQIHSSIVKNISSSKNPQKCDALITNQKNTPLMVMVADCIPILFYDNIKKVIAVAHAGRAGTFENIAKDTIDKMMKDYSSNPNNIEIILGPSIQKCCYEVSQELVNITSKKFGDKFVNNRNIDLQGINKKQLLEKGIKKENINISDICTKCSNQPYFSYRKDSKCGRFAGIIMLPSFT